MQRRQLGTTSMQITPLGFGSWAIGGGDWEFGWGPQDERQAIDAVRRAIELGINWIDTAAVYGLGRSEELVAQALQGISPRPYIFTKCSMRWNEERTIYRSLKAESVRAECEASLKRLKVDTIDLYQIHWPNPEDEIEEGWEEMARLKEEGKVRYIGVSNFTVQQMERAHRIAPISSLQPPYSLIRRQIEGEILSFCRTYHIGIIAYSPMASGLLTGAMTRERIDSLPSNDWRTRNKEFQEPLLSRNLALVELLQQIGQRHGRSAGEVAIAWTLRDPVVTGAIVGARSPHQADGIIGAGDLRLSDGELREIDRFRSTWEESPVARV